MSSVLTILIARNYSEEYVFHSAFMIDWWATNIVKLTTMESMRARFLRLCKFIKSSSIVSYINYTRG